MTQRLTGKSCIITGSSSGIGRAIALAFARHGAGYVLCVDLHSGPTTSTAEGPGDTPSPNLCPTHELLIAQLGPSRASFHKADVTNEAEVMAMVAKVVSVVGRLDILVNNAGVGPAGTPLHATSDEGWSTTLDVNLRGPFLCSKHAIQQFLKQDDEQSSSLLSKKRGSIVNISSAGGLRELKNSGPYVVSKAALISLTKVTALEYAGQRIQCNAICPGFIRTPLTEAFFDDPGFAAWRQVAVPWGAGSLSEGTDEVANAATWLAGDETAWVTGIALPVDGGYAVHIAE